MVEPVDSAGQNRDSRVDVAVSHHTRRVHVRSNELAQVSGSQQRQPVTTRLERVPARGQSPRRARLERQPDQID